MAEKKLYIPLETKEVGDDGSFSGYGSVFGVRDSYNEIVIPGAFKESLQRWQERGRLPQMLWQHRSSEPIGKYTEMREDEKGLFVRGSIITSLQKGQEAYTLLKEGIISGLSIGFNTVDDEWDNENRQRLLKKVNLWEVSLVTFPANEAAQVEAVKAANEINSLKECELFLRKNGWSQNDARLIAAKGFKEFLNHREGGKGIDANHREGETLEKLSSGVDRAMRVLTDK